MEPGIAKKSEDQSASQTNANGVKSNSSGKIPESRPLEPVPKAVKMSPPPKEGDESREEKEEEDDKEEAFCGACGWDYYSTDEFWTCCDICEIWFHGKCVKITPAKAEHMEPYKCPSCSSKQEDDEQGAVCGACGDRYNYATDEFWICCDICERWLHGKCVNATDEFWISCDICERWFHGKCENITPAKGEHIKQYKCPSCSSKEEDDEQGTVCGACGGNYATHQFWIGCDICERWFHGKCVKITPAKAEQLKQYKCPSCSNKNTSLIS